MADPFDVLREVRDAEPNVAAIRSRARGIQRRRYAVLSSSAVVIVIVATIGLVAFRPERSTRDLADAPEATASQAQTFGGAKAESGGAVSGPAADSGRAASVAPNADTTAATGGGTSAQLRVAPAPELDLVLEVKDRVPRGAALTLKACNKTTQEIQRSFGDAQRYDFEVSRDKKVVWRWSDGRAFAQMYGTETWKPGECKTYTEDWNGTTNSGAPAGPGTYRAVGILDSQPEQRTKPKDVCLDVC